MFVGVNSEKGLENKFGENNCFLNVVIQGLWHLTSFRDKFITWDTHTHIQSDSQAHCIHCALKSIFVQYQHSPSNLIPPTSLRQTLHNSYISEARFQMGELDDAAEALEAVLEKLHNAVNTSDGERNCIPHIVFGIDMTKVVKCVSCKAVSEPEPSRRFMEYVYVSTLHTFHEKMPYWKFELLLKASGHEMKGCPAEKCERQSLVTRNLHNLPEVFCIGLVWPSTNPTPEEIMSTLHLIQQTIDIGFIFNLTEKMATSYRFRGMICFYGKHYDAYFYSRSNNKWWVFDDATAREVGSTWNDVLNRCRLGHFHPSVLFYEREPGTYKPVKVEFKHPTTIVHHTPAPSTSAPALMSAHPFSTVRAQPHNLYPESINAAIASISGGVGGMQVGGNDSSSSLYPFMGGYSSQPASPYSSATSSSSGVVKPISYVINNSSDSIPTPVITPLRSSSNGVYNQTPNYDHNNLYHQNSSEALVHPYINSSGYAASPHATGYGFNNEPSQGTNSGMVRPISLSSSANNIGTGPMSPSINLLDGPIYTPLSHSGSNIRNSNNSIPVLQPTAIPSSIPASLSSSNTGVLPQPIDLLSSNIDQNGYQPDLTELYSTTSTTATPDMPENQYFPRKDVSFESIKPPSSTRVIENDSVLPFGEIPVLNSNNTNNRYYPSKPYVPLPSPLFIIGGIPPGYKLVYSPLKI